MPFLCFFLLFPSVLFRRQTPVLQFFRLSGDWYNGMWQLTGQNSSEDKSLLLMLNTRYDHCNVLLYFSFSFIRLSKNDLIMQLQVLFKFINSLSTSCLLSALIVTPNYRLLDLVHVHWPPVQLPIFAQIMGRIQGMWSWRNGPGVCCWCVGLVPSQSASEALHHPLLSFRPSKSEALRLNLAASCSPV